MTFQDRYTPNNINGFEYADKEEPQLKHEHKQKHKKHKHKDKEKEREKEREKKHKSDGRTSQPPAIAAAPVVNEDLEDGEIVSDAAETVVAGEEQQSHLPSGLKDAAQGSHERFEPAVEQSPDPLDNDHRSSPGKLSSKALDPAPVEQSPAADQHPPRYAPGETLNANTSMYVAVACHWYVLWSSAVPCCRSAVGTPEGQCCFRVSNW